MARLALLSFGPSSPPLSLPSPFTLFPFFFVTGRRMQKREGSSKASLETGSPAAPPRAITLPHGISPLREAVAVDAGRCLCVLRFGVRPPSRPLLSTLFADGG